MANPRIARPASSHFEAANKAIDGMYEEYQIDNDAVPGYPDLAANSYLTAGVRNLITAGTQLVADHAPLLGVAPNWNALEDFVIARQDEVYRGLGFNQAAWDKKFGDIQTWLQPNIEAIESNPAAAAAAAVPGSPEQTKLNALKNFNDDIENLKVTELKREAARIAEILGREYDRITNTRVFEEMKREFGSEANARERIWIKVAGPKENLEENDPADPHAPSAIMTGDVLGPQSKGYGIYKSPGLNYYLNFHEGKNGSPVVSSHVIKAQKSTLQNARDVVMDLAYIAVVLPTLPLLPFLAVAHVIAQATGYVNDNGTAKLPWPSGTWRNEPTQDFTVSFKDQMNFIAMKTHSKNVDLDFGTTDLNKYHIENIIKAIWAVQQRAGYDATTIPPRIMNLGNALGLKLSMELLGALAANSSEDMLTTEMKSFFLKMNYPLTDYKKYIFAQYDEFNEALKNARASLDAKLEATKPAAPKTTLPPITPLIKPDSSTVGDDLRSPGTPLSPHLPLSEEEDDDVLATLRAVDPTAEPSDDAQDLADDKMREIDDLLKQIYDDEGDYNKVDDADKPELQSAKQIIAELRDAEEYNDDLMQRADDIIGVLQSKVNPSPSI